MEWMEYQAVVDMHLPSGFTKLRWHAGGDLYFDVRTESIPLRLRSIGTKVLLRVRVGASSPGETTPAVSESIVVEDLPRKGV